ncbi:hypothetical protein BDF19DRAFT_310531 [Syncephalis fuscata]|nr:hypothetical protein BDF19DRAFT_310531 [Syncephalis fuscata]
MLPTLSPTIFLLICPSGLSYLLAHRLTYFSRELACVAVLVQGSPNQLNILSSILRNELGSSRVARNHFGQRFAHAKPMCFGSNRYARPVWSTPSTVSLCRTIRCASSQQPEETAETTFTSLYHYSSSTGCHQ